MDKSRKNEQMGKTRLEQGMIELIFEYNQFGYFIRILDYANFPAFLRAVMAMKRARS